MLGSGVADREARADCQCGELINRIAPSLPVRELFLVEALGLRGCHSPGIGRDHSAGVELATIDAHGAAGEAVDLEGRLYDGVARQARPDRFEIGDFARWTAAGHSVPPRLIRGVRKVLNSTPTRWLPPPFSALTSNGPALRDNPVYDVEGPPPRATTTSESYGFSIPKISVT